MDIIEIGDKVSHKHLLIYNLLLMTVTDTEDGKIFCEYFDNESKIIKQATFETNDLEIIQKVDGAFV
jgi:hypothetical protein